jgi:beta-lactamase regulating signal transducer with metallopeptidase domain
MPNKLYSYLIHLMVMISKTIPFAPIRFYEGVPERVDSICVRK